MTTTRPKAGAGTKAPDFALPLLGQSQALTSGELKGSPAIVVNFWASWCVPCREEAPELEATWRQYRAQGVRFLGVNVQDSPDDALAFVKEFGITFGHVAWLMPVYRRRRAPPAAFPGCSRVWRSRLGWPLCLVGLALFLVSNIGARTGIVIFRFDPHHGIGQLGGALIAIGGLDGHAVRGSFRFGVGVSPAGPAEAGGGTTPGPADLVTAVGRWLEALALRLAVGMLLLRGLAAGYPELSWVRPRVRPVAVVALTAGLGVVLAEASAAAGSAGS